MHVDVALIRTMPAPGASSASRSFKSPEEAEPYEFEDPRYEWLLLPDELYSKIAVDVPWGDRPRVSLDLPGTRTVEELIDAAAQELGVTANPRLGGGSTAALASEISFAVGDDGNQRGRLVGSVDLDGAARWDRWIGALTLADLAAADNAGLVVGDAHRLYVGVDPKREGVGNGFDLWSNAVPIMLDAFMLAGGVHGSVVALRSGYGVIKRSMRRWARRGAGPGEIYRSSISRPRTTEEVARLLDVADTDAAALLTLFGLEEGGDGKWRPSEHGFELRRLMLALEVAERMWLPVADVLDAAEEVFQLPVAVSEDEEVAQIREVFERRSLG